MEPAGKDGRAMAEGPAPDLPLLRIEAGRERRVVAGHPWVFSNELRMGPALREVPLGGLVRLQTAHGDPVGIAGLNRHALIAARLFTRDPAEAVDRRFLARRLARALALRDVLFDRPFYRLVHAEADGLPGLVVDRYGSLAVVQANAAAIDRLLDDLLPALEETAGIDTIVLRNDSPARALEGLPEEVTLAQGRIDGPVPVEENGARFLADPLGGQKTGWFYDQRENRAFAARLAAGRTVLDVYAHTGGFGILAALAGARQVEAVDRSESALELAAEAARRNAIADRIAVVRAEAFAHLQALGEAGERRGLVIVDPPAFVKSARDLKAGARGYRKLARLAARVVEPGGFLCASSCSHHLDMPLFTEQLRLGLADAGRTGRFLRLSGAGPDHPLHPFLPESA
jgi:23S rRNA (cytosine1962-C5)-methyltransferase